MKRTTVTILAAITMLAALSGSAKAALLTFNLNEVGSDVVGTVSGTLNTNVLTSTETTITAGGRLALGTGILALKQAYCDGANTCSGERCLGA